MKENLKESIERIKRSYSENGRLNEEATKMSMIVPILDALGWSVYDTREIHPEYSIGSSRVDYAILINGNPKVFLEAKKVYETLEGHEAQLLKYSFERGVKMAVLTNGITWWFYLPLKEGNWDRRKFYTIELKEQEVDDIAEKFISFLSKDVVVSGDYIKNAENVLKSKEKNEVIMAALPGVWNKLMNSPPEDLINIVAEATENVCGYKPEKKVIENFMLKVSYSRAQNNESKRTSGQNNEKKITEGEEEKHRKNHEYVRQGYTAKKPEKIILFGKEYPVRSWKDVLVKTAEEIFRMNPNDTEKAFDIKGTKREYFSRYARNMKAPYELEEFGIYIETHFSANDITKHCKELLLKYGYPEGSLQIIAR